jgi:hypothetical protein
MEPVSLAAIPRPAQPTAARPEIAMIGKRHALVPAAQHGRGYPAIRAWRLTRL